MYVVGGRQILCRDACNSSGGLLVEFRWTKMIQDWRHTLSIPLVSIPGSLHAQYTPIVICCGYSPHYLPTRPLSCLHPHPWEPSLILTLCVCCVTWWGPWVSMLWEFLLLLFRPRATGRVPLIWNILICPWSEEGLWGLGWGIVFYLGIERLRDLLTPHTPTNPTPTPHPQPQPPSVYDVLRLVLCVCIHMSSWILSFGGGAFTVITVAWLNSPC